ncbi:MAG: hypothetical protein OZSIB_0078 [Candidatus Ozemobacter sibiricus]|uniref:Fibronectin type-III domain-containing protein n=1 Tax=Candidatus Ozemobacter sibiricus TaxID=2268124 RepID=A0A367ZMT3_9BACT|nr:MAG: hypothetical protein OZSIB_0078 [Candidatus Ozemobacter sibiricus]
MEPPAWDLSLAQVAAALQTASGSSWTAGETAVTLGFSQAEAALLCGALPDPQVPASVLTGALMPSATLENAEQPQGQAATSTVGAVAVEAAAAALPLPALPARFSWREQEGGRLLPAVKAQGKWGTGVAFAVLAAFEARLRLTDQAAAANGLDLSEWDLWYHGTGGRPPVPGGWYPSAALDFLTTTGVVTEEACPYATVPSPPVTKAGQIKHRARSWSLVLGEDALKAAILEGPVVGLMPVKADFFYYRGGIYEPTVGPDVGELAFLLVGYDDEQRCWIGQTSWSASWGENGFFRIRSGWIRPVGFRVVVEPTNSSAASATPASPPAPTTPTLTGEPGAEIVAEIPADPATALGPFIRAVTASTAEVIWSTAAEGVGQVELIEARSGKSQVIPARSAGRFHAALLADLAPQTGYQMRASVQAAGGAAMVSQPLAFITLSVASATPPTPIIFNVAVSRIASQSAVVTFKTDKDAAARIIYQAQTATQTTTRTDLRLQKDHSFTLSNLTGGTLYTFTVQAWIDTGATATSDLEQFTTTEVTPPVITMPAAVQVVATAATIVWQTNEPSTSQVEWGLTPAYGWSTQIDQTLVEGHRMRLTNLTPGTLYHVRVRSKDAAGNEAVGGAFTFTTLTMLEVTPIAVSNASATQVTATSATIVWQSSKPGSSQVDYGLSAGFGWSSPFSPTLTQSHMVSLTGLSPSTQYSYRVRSIDAQGNEAMSGELRFRTPAAPDPTPMVLSNATATQITANTATIVWASNRPSTTQVEYGLTPAYGMITPRNTAMVLGHQVALSGLKPDTDYYYRVSSIDEAGNVASLAAGPFRTVDSVPPTVCDLQVATMTGTTASITFTTSEPAFATVEYGFGDFALSTLPNAVATTTFVVGLTGLTPQRAYRYRVRATDLARNSGLSVERSFTTPDTVGPVIWAVTAGQVTLSTAVITWTTDENSTSQVEWGSTPGVYTATSPFDPTLTRAHVVRISGFDGTVSPVWYYRVWSSDTAGNRSVSEERSFTVPFTLSAIAVSNLTATTASITWESTASATSLVEYGPTTAYGFQAPSIVDPFQLTQNHAVSLTGLNPYTLYNFRVRCRDITGLEVVSKNYTFMTPQSAAPPIISDLITTNITQLSALVSWKTDTDSTTVVDYGTESGRYTMRAVDGGGLTTQHRVTLSGLRGGRTYYYIARSTDAQGREATSTERIFQTPGVPAPVISSVRAVNQTDTSATIYWLTDVACTSQVEYGTTSLLGIQTPLSTAATTTHAVALTNLLGGTAYQYRVRSRHPDTGLESVSPVETFTTQDTTGPVITEVQVIGIGTTTATVIWKTDENADRQVFYWTGSNPVQSTPLGTVLGRTHSVTLVGLSASTTYSFYAQSKDRFNNASTSAIGVFSTLDRTPPVISNVAVVAVAGTVATITFTTDEPAVPQVDYGLTTAYGTTRPLLPAPTGTSHTVLLDGLVPGTTYKFRLRATDLAGNVALTRDYTFTSLDTLPPLISGVTVTSIAENAATIVWRTDELSDTVVEYGTTMALGTTVSRGQLTRDHALALSFLTGNQTYYFKVVSTDASGNTAQAGVYTFKTLDRTPPVITVAPAATTILEESATIEWTTDEPATSRIEYGKTTAYGSVMQITDALTTSHRLVIDGLTPLTTYQFRVRSKDAAGNEVISGNYSFTTPALLLIQNVQLLAVTATQASLLWETSVPATCEIAHGRTNPPTNAGIAEDNVPGVGAPGTSSHTVTLFLDGAPLPSATTYFFQIKATTSNGVTRTSGLRFFLTP